MESALPDPWWQMERAQGRSPGAGYYATDPTPEPARRRKVSSLLHAHPQPVAVPHGRSATLKFVRPADSRPGSIERCRHSANEGIGGPDPSDVDIVLVSIGY